MTFWYLAKITLTSTHVTHCKVVLKNSNYGTIEFEKNENFEMEMGDVLYSLLSLANETQIDIEISLEKVLDKYKKRIENKKDMGSGR